MAVGGAHSEFADSPGLIRWRRRDDGAFGGDFLVEVVDVIDVPVGVVGMVAKLAGRLFVAALAEHDSESVAREEAPAGGIDRFLTEAEDVGVVLGRDGEVADCENTPVIDNLRHDAFGATIIAKAIFSLDASDSEASGEELC